jgi:hypothetical protein
LPDESAAMPSEDSLRRQYRTGLSVVTDPPYPVLGTLGHPTEPLPAAQCASICEAVSADGKIAYSSTLPAKAPSAPPSMDSPPEPLWTVFSADDRVA